MRQRIQQLHGPNASTIHILCNWNSSLIDHDKSFSRVVVSEVYGFAVFTDFFYDICAVLRFELACDLHFLPNIRCGFFSSVFGYFELWFCSFNWCETFEEFFGLINANMSPVASVSSVSKSAHAFFGHKPRNQRYSCLACWLLAIICAYLRFLQKFRVVLRFLGPLWQPRF